MRVYLARHGQTEWNAEGRAQGHTDIPLDAVGRRQALQLAKRLKAMPLSKVYSSDLSRSAETARAVALECGSELVLTPELRERCFGEWEGLDFESVRRQIRQGATAEETLSFRPPGGESVSDVWTRLEPFVMRLKASDQDCAVISHGGACALILSQMLNAGIAASRSFRFGNAALVELESREDGAFTLSLYNDTSHLDSGVLIGDLQGTSR